MDAAAATPHDQLTGTGLDDDAGASTGSASGQRYATSASAPNGSNGSDRLGDAAGGVVDRVSGTAEKQANMGLTRAGDAIAQTASAIRQTGAQMREQQPQVAGFADIAAQRLDEAARFVREQDLQGLMREAEDFARRQPAVFLGGAFALGLVASRFLKASPEDGGAFRRGHGSGYGAGHGARSGSGTSTRSGSSYRSGGYGAVSNYAGAALGSTQQTGYGSAETGYAGTRVAPSAAADLGTTATDSLTGAEHGRA